MVRKFCVGGNWKMNGNKKEINDIVAFLKAGPLDPNVEVIVGCPAIYLQSTKSILPPNISIAAQNCYKVPSGAFTGEISPAMLVDSGIPWVILGHSERRNVFGENDQLIAEKVAHALEAGVKFICDFTDRDHLRLCEFLSVKKIGDFTDEATFKTVFKDNGSVGAGQGERSYTRNAFSVKMTTFKKKK